MYQVLVHVQVITSPISARIMMSETPYDNRARRQLQNFNSKEEEMILE